MPTEMLLFLLAAGAGVPFYADKSDLLYYMTPRGDKVEIRNQGAWKTRRTHIVANMEAVMGAAPKLDRSRPDVVVLEEVRLEKYTRRKITYRAEGTDLVPAYLL